MDKIKSKEAEKWYITQPLPASNLYHVFSDDGRSLCRKFFMLIKQDELCTAVTGDEVYQRGTDCKACFDKILKAYGVCKECNTRSVCHDFGCQNKNKQNEK